MATPIEQVEAAAADIVANWKQLAAMPTGKMFMGSEMGLAQLEWNLRLLIGKHILENGYPH